MSLVRRPPVKRLAVIAAMAAVLLNFDAAFACSTKTKAYVTAMKSDLRNVVEAQAEFLKANGRHAKTAAELQFPNSHGVTVTFRHVGAAGYAATTTHSEILQGTCFLFVGPRPPELDLKKAPRDGEPFCAEEIKSRYDIQNDAEERIAGSFWVFLFALTLATAFFLSQKGRRNWPSRGLLGLTLVYPFLVLGMCGGADLHVLPFFVVPALGLFYYALRRRITAAT